MRRFWFSLCAAFVVESFNVVIGSVGGVNLDHWLFRDQLMQKTECVTALAYGAGLLADVVVAWVYWKDQALPKYLFWASLASWGLWLGVTASLVRGCPLLDPWRYVWLFFCTITLGIASSLMAVQALDFTLRDWGAKPSRA